jgi:cation diffusion facilitator family transporter
MFPGSDVGRPLGGTTWLGMRNDQVSEELQNQPAVVQAAARVSLIFNIVQTCLKIIAAVLTGSVSLLSEALHSISDVISSFVSFVSVRAASAPPDDEHPYGHGKIDTLAGLSEAILLFVFAVYTVVISFLRFFEKPTLNKVDTGIWLALVCVVGAYFVRQYVEKIATRTNSFALSSNAQHLQSDIVTTIGVLIALIVTRLTGWLYADAAFALVFSLWLGYSAVKMIRNAFHEVIDHTIDPMELEAIKEIITSEPEMLSYHKLRTRHSGTWHYIDLHIVVPRHWTLIEAHTLADRIEKRIETRLAPAVCTIHVDPDEPR